MKKIIIAVVLFLNVGIFAQNKDVVEIVKDSSTNVREELTKDEYAYLTKGLKIQIENGLDTKNGYVFEKLHKNNYGGYSFSYSAFFKKDTKDFKAISIIIKSNNTDKSYYLAMPTAANSIVSVGYNQDVNGFDAVLAKSYAFSLSRFMRDKLYELYIINNKK